jgi:excisionase family DNA binding protein
MLNERMLTIPDVATFLKIPQSSVYKLIHESGLPAHRVGKHYRLVQGEVDTWLRKEDLDQELETALAINA